MFVISITKLEIENNLQEFIVEQRRINSSIVTLVTDDFLSCVISESDGFSIIESPFKSNKNLDN